ncbi:axial budding pattern protein 2 [Aspergillus udagawae]|uniref:Axial budding pattern protein 2 n=1 Tax=Aspergillus udagawae TaxID=91492 RepID=A0ABQ1BDR6_9EURO|nr:axial budding pattern protein 2 [Aspergillus udagawae]GFF99430.1 axial budding pattern protein 2 [Aspergillus udagawae]
MALIALVVLALLVAVNASLVLNYPVNAQLPPVARVSRPFHFVFSPGTFGGKEAGTQYSLQSAPSWLHLDSSSRTLSGTPTSLDTGPNKFKLVATNGPDSASMEVTLVVTAEDGPKPGKPLLPQLEAIGATSAPSTIFVHSGDSFVISFDHATFSNTRTSTFFYGTSPQNTPLPSWVRFDPSNLAFSGTTPNTGPQAFTFNLVASDVAGFSAATMSFEMIVSPHILSFNQSTQTLFLTRGKQFNSSHFRDILTLDGRQPGNGEVTSTEAQAPSWLTFDRDTISLSGTPPANAMNENVTISVRDTYGDVTRMIVALQYSQFFTEDIKECNAVIGDDFVLVFNNSILKNDSVQLEVNLGQRLPWLRYNSDSKTLYGHVPSDLEPGSFPITLTARDGTAEDSEQFIIRAVRRDRQDGSVAKSADSNNGSGAHGKKAGIIATAVVIPVVFVMVLLALFCCWRHKRKTKAATQEEEQFPTEKDPRLTPSDLPPCRPYEAVKPDDPPIILRSPSPSSKPPKLELRPLWSEKSLEENRQAHDSDDKENSLSHSTIEWDFAPLTRHNPQEENQAEDIPSQNKRLSFQSSPSLHRRTTANSTKREPLKSIQPRRSLKRNSAASSRSRRYSRRSSGISSVASGLPVRLSGAGHGAGGLGPPGHGVVRVSWQNTHASLQSDESSVGNLAPLFPRPPPRGRNSVEFRVLDHPRQLTVRAVEPESPTISESDSLEAFVHYRAKNRNSSNPMFSAQFTRRTSSGLRALERARSTASRADTMSSSIYNDGRRQSYIQDRPGSMAMSAMSASVYTEDNRNSAFLQSLGLEASSVRPIVPLPKKQSQSSLAQNYSKIISPLPRFFSETSLSSNRRLEHGNLVDTSDDSQNVNEDSCGSRRRSYRGNPYLQGDFSTHRFSLRRSPSTSSVPVDSTVRRVSLVRFAGMEIGGDQTMNYDQRWRNRQSVSIEQPGDSVQRDVINSVRSDATFV